MDRERFAARLEEAAAAARAFARTFIEEALPEAMTFRVRLNASYDGNPLHADESVFPEDGSFRRAVELHSCTAEDAVGTLWRQGRVPEWIDVSVVGETETATVVELRCCGRFTANDALLYHAREGRPPFHVLGPSLPAHIPVDATPPFERFSIYDHSQCWTLDELQRVEAHAGRVWSLHVVGPAFDDAVLERLPELPRMRLLTLMQSSIVGHGLQALERQPNLRGLTIWLAPDAPFQVRISSLLPRIESLTVRDLPQRPWGSDTLLSKLTHLASLTMSSPGPLFADGMCPSTVRALSIEATQLHGTFRPPRTLESLHLHLNGAGDADIESLLREVETLEGLDLSDSPVGDALVDQLTRRFALRYLNVAKTNVTPAAMTRMAAAHPGLKLVPKPTTKPGRRGDG